ncbi:hypothetical protein [Ekhidna sp.]|uniref:hypothetical protein n=1 Tax=Ekhidna sp. TaxID=2608089 RepID=UPI003BABA431
MTWIYVIIAIVILMQVGIFIMSHRIRKREKEDNVLLKYNINSRQRAWQLLADPDVSDDDKVKIREYYDAE